MNEMHGHFWSILGWLAFALNVWGNLALTTKGIRGWIIRIGSNACWIPYGLMTGAIALTANHALFACINAYGWWKWTQDARRVVTPGETPLTDERETVRRVAYAQGFEAGRRAERALHEDTKRDAR